MPNSEFTKGTIGAFLASAVDNLDRANQFARGAGAVRVSATLARVKADIVALIPELEAIGERERMDTTQ